VKNLTLEVIREEGRTPVIFMEVPATPDCKTNETVLLYGHMDKQPPLTESWYNGKHPYQPVIENGKLYGRGSSDDGYSTFSAITAIKAIQEQGQSHSRLIVLIESCEESGSLDLPYYMKKLSARLGQVGLIVCLDSGSMNYEQFWLTTSLRGIADGTLKVKILREGVHSGDASGVVPSTFRIARQLLERLEDSNTGKILLKELYVDIPNHRIEQAKQTAQALGESIWRDHPFVNNGFAVDKDGTQLLLNKTWIPQLEVIGADGFPSCKTAGNVLRPETHLQLSIRLPPHVDSVKATQLIKQTLEKDPPYGASVVFESGEDPANGWESPALASWLESSLNSASKTFFNKPPMLFGEGGSIPFMQMLGEQFPAAQFVITGVLGPGSNAHGPNEFLHIDMAKNVTCCVAHILHDFHQKQ